MSPFLFSYHLTYHKPPLLTTASLNGSSRHGLQITQFKVLYRIRYWTCLNLQPRSKVWGKRYKKSFSKHGPKWTRIEQIAYLGIEAVQIPEQGINKGSVTLQSMRFFSNLPRNFVNQLRRHFHENFNKEWLYSQDVFLLLQAQGGMT